MKFIILDEKHGETKTLVLKGWVRILLTAGFFGLPLLLGYYAYHVSSARDSGLYNSKTAQVWAEKLTQQEQEIEKVRQGAVEKIQALTIRLAGLQAQLLRLDALGERLTSAADIDDAEFNFTEVATVGVGGPITPEAMNSDLLLKDEPLDFMTELNALTLKIADRQQQLEILDSVISDRQFQSEIRPAGRPISKGWLSSHYGRRIDPFTGKKAWHQGVDFATGNLGEDVLTVASGVVMFAAERQGYGLLVKIAHGNGYETWYGHGQELLVNAGDVVKKGQVIALSGSSGRSTGPHVHFEVHKNGKTVDPASYIQRTNP